MAATCELSFEDWFEERTGKSLKRLHDEAFFSGSAQRMRDYRRMEDAYRRMHAEWLSSLKDWEAYREHPDLNTFVVAYSGHTFGELHDLALATGNYKSYEKLAAWYRNRYELLHENPFLAGGDAGDAGM